MRKLGARRGSEITNRLNTLRDTPPLDCRFQAYPSLPPAKASPRGGWFFIRHLQRRADSPVGARIFCDQRGWSQLGGAEQSRARARQPARRKGRARSLSVNLAGGQFTPGTGFTFPFRFRHGSVLPLSAAEYARLKAAYGDAAK